jgi:hypothetical protein
MTRSEPCECLTYYNFHIEPFHRTYIQEHGIQAYNSSYQRRNRSVQEVDGWKEVVYDRRGQGHRKERQVFHPDSHPRFLTPAKLSLL